MSCSSNGTSPRRLFRIIARASHCWRILGLEYYHSEEAVSDHGLCVSSLACIVAQVLTPVTNNYFARVTSPPDVELILERVISRGPEKLFK